VLAKRLIQLDADSQFVRLNKRAEESNHPLARDPSHCAPLPHGKPCWETCGCCSCSGCSGRCCFWMLV
jgi:hypothetical protein